MKLFRPLVRRPWLIPLLLFLLTLLHPMGFRLNWNTISQPKGLYRLERVSVLDLKRHRLVLVRPPIEIARVGRERGYLAFGELAKCIAALPGDRVEVTAQGLRVNGRLLPGTALLSHDSQGRPVQPYPPGPHETLPGWLWLYSNHIPNSWDSRYFGPVPMDAVVGRLHPIFTTTPFPRDSNGDPTCAWIEAP